MQKYRRKPAKLPLEAAAATPVMLAAAVASDMREAFPGFHDEEEADRSFPTFHGSVELALAQEA